MTDQDRLDHELAAKAAGYVLTFKQGGCKGGAYCGAFIERGGELVAWRPKEDDGDSFRLAVNLNMCVTVTRLRAYAERYSDNNADCFEELGSDSHAATRLAVFRCAVEIGRAKQ